VPAPEITISLLDGRQAAGHAGELAALHAEVYGAAPADQDAPASTSPRRTVLFRQPGFVLAEARHGGYLVGYACGMPLRPATSWWRDLTTPLPGDVTTEHPGRTFAVTGLLVRAAWRRQGIGTDLHEAILGGRAEERATLTASPTAAPAQHALRAWGWHKIARIQDPRPGSPVCDVFLTQLGT
jgi:GNAT superfamily N-acetyltransferase